MLIYAHWSCDGGLNAIQAFSSLKSAHSGVVEAITALVRDEITSYGAKEKPTPLSELMDAATKLRDKQTTLDDLQKLINQYEDFVWVKYGERSAIHSIQRVEMAG